MPLTKSSAPGNEPTRPTDEQAANQTGQGNTSNPADAKDRQVDQTGYHDSLTGRPVDASGRFLEGDEPGTVPQHRIVADNWPDHEANTK